MEKVNENLSDHLTKLKTKVMKIKIIKIKVINFKYII